MRILALALPLLLAACTGGGRQADDEIPYGDLTEEQKRQPEHALSSFTLHEGLDLALFASEPMLINPTNLDVDERGRAWVCEAQNYRRFNHDHPEREAGDRILILEDQNGDGQADTAKVFYQGPEVNAALGIAKLGEKVYVAASPNMLVFTDADGDDKPEKMDTLFTGLGGVDHDHGVHAIVFGPDGKLYFNFGNEGKQLRRKDGSLAVDLHGNPVEEGKSHRQGMVFRCNPDGSELEILGHNFRNNFELAIDAYGRMWQSDNDDDGNEGTRINYVMDYGNYGFRDEVTGAAWQQPRIGMHEEVPMRHWHLNDPGVVPNLLQTGSGSPTGILVYEGDQLPEAFHGQMIHCEPGHNVVRAYPVRPSAAGYAAEITPLIESADQWFRPSDVCAAPDGSLLVTDWYDRGVGGHLMADIERGRVYRIYGAGAEEYTVRPPDLSTVANAIDALDHVNQATRYLAYQRLMGEDVADKPLLERLTDAATPSRLRARLAWLLADRREGMQNIAAILWNSGDVYLQELALRMARQYPGPEHELLLSLVELALSGDEPALLREAALNLRYVDDPLADELYAQLANRYDGTDRWYLEALGIASDRFASRRLRAYLATDPDLTTTAARDLLWRSRAPEAVAQYRKFIRESRDSGELARYFRALHFHNPAVADPVIEEALYTENHPAQEKVVRYALASMNAETLAGDERLQRRVRAIMPELRGSDVWLLVVENARVEEEAPIVLDSALASTDNAFRERAVKIAYGLMGPEAFLARYRSADATEKVRLVDLSRYLHNDTVMDWLKDMRVDDEISPALRKTATRSIANMWHGMTYLLNEVKADTEATEASRELARLLSQSWRSDIREGAMAWLAEHRRGEAIDLERIATLEGDPLAGSGVFTEYCAACHQVNGAGVRYGPNLDRIGEKLDAGGLLAAIAYPSQGIGFGYEGYEFLLDDGTKLVGYIESQTEDDLTVRMMGGVSREVSKEAIAERKPLEESLMTAGLHTLMEEQELADLIAYLQTLQLAK